jgi:hypothetical protein
MTDKKPSYEDIWNKIRKYQGTLFHTKSGIQFTYQIRNTSIIVDGLNFPLTDTALRMAYDMWPVDGPGGFNKKFSRGSHVWGIFAGVTKDKER